MPTIYKKKLNSNRANWSETNLNCAIEDIQNKVMSINEASRQYNIPGTTLRRHLKSKVNKKPALGGPSVLGENIETKLVAHIKKLQAHGFAPTRDEVCRMAFQLAENYKIKHMFNKTSQKAGTGWFNLFMRRHSELSIRKSEGVSLARTEGMNKDTVSKYFTLLEEILSKNELLDKPNHIFNIDETGCQLNNRPEHVIAEKGSKNVAARTSAEKGETVTVIACCNAEGNFLPPACVFKGKNKKAEFEDGMPPGSVVYMGGKSAYVNTNIFFTWIKDHFSPRKPQGKVILLLDGHSSHCSNVEMLEYAAENEIILFCLPPHTTQFLQPLDRAFFKSFKSHFYAACKLFIKTNPSRKINRLQFGHLLNSAWGKSATASNGISAFSSTGIYPFNPDAIPEYAFLSNNQSENTNANEAIEIPIRDVSKTPPEKESTENQNKKITPGKMLNYISPIPSTSGVRTSSSRKQKARILTSEENISEQKQRLNKKTAKQTKVVRKKTRVARCESSTTDEENIEILLEDESCGPEDFGENNCAGCGEDYNLTKKKDDWIECLICKRWSHESCSTFINTCNACGNKNLKSK